MRRRAKADAVKFTLEGQIPSGKNAVLITRSGHRYPAQRFAAWRACAIDQLQEQGALDVYLDGIVEAVVTYFAGDNRRRDVPGMIDALWHLVEKTGIVADDANIKHVRWETLKDAQRPRVEVELRAKL